MLIDVRPLKLAQSKTMRAIFFFSFKCSSFPTLPITALVQRFGSQGGTWKKERKKVATKPFPGNVQSQGWSEHVAALAPTLWSSGFAGRGTDGDSSHSPCKRTVLEREKDCVYVCVCIIAILENSLYV